MKKLLALTLVAGSAIGMASMVTACGPNTVETTSYFLGHGKSDSSLYSGTVYTKTQNDYYNVIKINVKVEGGKILTAEVNESVDYIKASSNSVTISSNAKAKGTAVTDAQWIASTLGGTKSYAAKRDAWLATNTGQDEDAYKASDAFQSDLTDFKLDWTSGESTRYVYELVSVADDKVANISKLEDDKVTWTKTGFVAKTNANYGSDRFKFEQVKSTTEALFKDKTCDDVKNYKFDTRIKSVTSIPSTDTSIAGATASETTLYAAALQRVVKQSCELM